jgi:hypothetical protein
MAVIFPVRDGEGHHRNKRVQDSARREGVPLRAASHEGGGGLRGRAPTPMSACALPSSSMAEIETTLREVVEPLAKLICRAGSADEQRLRA